jgi:hypothetical protein
MQGVFIGTVRIGSVAKFAGEPPARRWIAYASEDRKQGFPTRKQAIAWLEQLHDERKGTEE